jgi:hypothetical protein
MRSCIRYLLFVYRSFFFPSSFMGKDGWGSPPIGLTPRYDPFFLWRRTGCVDFERHIYRYTLHGRGVSKRQGMGPFAGFLYRHLSALYAERVGCG